MNYNKIKGIWYVYIFINILVFLFGYKSSGYFVSGGEGDIWGGSFIHLNGYSFGKRFTKLFSFQNYGIPHIIFWVFLPYFTAKIVATFKGITIERLFNK